MGFNTTVVVMNNALKDIEGDIRFGYKLATKIRLCGSGEKKWVSAGDWTNAALVVETHHAEEIVTVAVGENNGSIVRSDDGNPVCNHFCYACGRPHEGYEEKYCPICGKAAQERKTLYDTLYLILQCLRDVDDEKAKRARDLVLEALVVAPEGERLNVLDWRAIYDRRITVAEAYEQLEEKKTEKCKTPTE